MEIIKDYITKNKYSRPGTALQRVTKIVVHYVGNPGSTAKNNRDYFNNMPAVAKTRPDAVRYVSAHYVIGLDGEIIACVPENEIAYCSNSANSYSISIENCHPDSGGRFDPKTLQALTMLLCDLCRRYRLDPKTDIIRHYDVTGKACPLWYVSHPEQWEALRGQVAALLAGKEEPATGSASTDGVSSGEISTDGISDSEIFNGDTDSRTLYRVQVGAFSQRAGAEAMRERLQAAGYPSLIVRAQS